MQSLDCEMSQPTSLLLGNVTTSELISQGCLLRSARRKLNIEMVIALSIGTRSTDQTFPYLPTFSSLCILGRFSYSVVPLLIPEAGLTDKDICHTVSAPV
jgi:hypothetical protein